MVSPPGDAPMPAVSTGCTAIPGAAQGRRGRETKLISAESPAEAVYSGVLSPGGRSAVRRPPRCFPRCPMEIALLAVIGLLLLAGLVAFGVGNKGWNLGTVAAGIN